MIEITTTCNGETITWQVAISVAMRREIHKREALYLLGEQLVVNTHAVLEVIVPEGIADVTADGERRGGNVIPPVVLPGADGSTRCLQTAEVETWMWGLPMLHLDSLATQVGSYLYTGIEPGTEPEEDDASPTAAEDAAVPPLRPGEGNNYDEVGRPLVEQIASSGRATDSTRPEGGSAEGDTPSPT